MLLILFATKTKWRFVTPNLVPLAVTAAAIYVCNCCARLWCSTHRS